jgi:hypothetical protein
MQLALTAHLPFRRTRPARPDCVAETRSEALTRTQKARRAAANEDRALYSCCCGYAFTAAVSTTVGCPHCGSAQAW